ncbi:hypothetical protein [Alienimonas chondri]|uniref:YecA family protein n=1 Tax=Alienimonas chondri TaxID=2681879 RepID=A0ABX1VE53_9PLAN|nr:hypothetical protein [Alienimonas chondri]NNJ26073.1 hypothetical protein [Alienimonas chondri]
MSRRKERQHRRDAAVGRTPRPENPPHPAVLALSEKFGPPGIDLRQARIIDDYGEDSSATHPIRHLSPWDVSREDCEFYQSFVFMGGCPTSLLFYLYPVALLYDQSGHLEAVHSFLFALNAYLPDLLTETTTSDQATLAEGLIWMYEAHGPDPDLFAGFENLIPLLGEERAAAIRQEFP